MKNKYQPGQPVYVLKFSEPLKVLRFDYNEKLKLFKYTLANLRNDQFDAYEHDIFPWRMTKMQIRRLMFEMNSGRNYCEYDLSANNA